MTGLPGSGKSTLAYALRAALRAQGKCAYVLDGDQVRQGLSAGLTHSADDRRENVRRVGEAAKMLMDVGVIAIVALVSPYRAGRDAIRRAVLPGAFVEVFVSASVEVCEARDGRGLYRRARLGHIAEFTGVSGPYEVPENAEVEIHSDLMTPVESVRLLVEYLDRGQTGWAESGRATRVSRRSDATASHRGSA